MAIRGGAKLNRFIRRAKAAKSIKAVEVGFFETAKYPDGTPVAAVAAWNEFGHQDVLERPFFRNAISDSKKELLEVLVENVDPRTMVVDRRVAGLMAQAMVGRIQRSITTLRSASVDKNRRYYRKKGQLKPTFGHRPHAEINNVSRN